MKMRWKCIEHASFTEFLSIEIQTVCIMGFYFIFKMRYNKFRTFPITQINRISAFLLSFHSYSLFWMGFHRVFIKGRNKKARVVASIVWIPEKWNFLVERNNNSSLSCPIHLMWQMTSIIHHFSSLSSHSHSLSPHFFYSHTFLCAYKYNVEYSTVQTTHILVMRKVPIHFLASTLLSLPPKKATHQKSFLFSLCRSVRVCCCGKRRRETSESDEKIVCVKKWKGKISSDLLFDGLN